MAVREQQAQEEGPHGTAPGRLEASCPAAWGWDSGRDGDRMDAGSSAIWSQEWLWARSLGLVSRLCDLGQVTTPRDSPSPRAEPRELPLQGPRGLGSLPRSVGSVSLQVLSP